MTDFATRRKARYRALRALYDLTVAQREPGSFMVPTLTLHEIAGHGGLSYDQAADAVTHFRLR